LFASSNQTSTGSSHYQKGAYNQRERAGAALIAVPLRFQRGHTKQRRGVMKGFLALGAAAVLIASPVLATPIDVITIEAILLAVVSVAAAIRAALSDSYSRASARKSLPEHRDARHSIH
jgi:hypothetical protein